MQRFCLITIPAMVVVAGAAFILGRFSASPRGAPDRRELVDRPTPLVFDDGLKGRGTVATVEPDPSARFATRLERLGAVRSSAAREEELRRELEAWAAIDPRGALNHVFAHFNRERQEQLVPLVIGTWAKSDPRAAWTWVNSEAAAKLTFPTLADAVLSETGKTQPALAWGFASDLAQQRPYDAQGLYVSVLRGVLYAGNFEAAIKLVGQAKFPAGEGRYDLTSLIASDWGQHEPSKAGEWLMRQPEGFERRQALISLGQSWAEVDAQRAADFAAQLPASLERTAMLSSAVDHWVTDHPGQVGEWLLRYKQDGDFDQIVAAVATNRQVVWENPNVAISWAETITDADIRITALSQIIDHWITRDARSAKTFLEGSNQLSPELRDELRQRLHIGG